MLASSSSPSMMMVSRADENAAIDVVVRRLSRSCSNSGNGTHIGRPDSLRRDTITRLSGSGIGSGRSMTALITEKIAALAPMPSASERMATAANVGLRRRIRKA